jgi:NDP-sugar pyrophosphorylase family protein
MILCGGLGTRLREETEVRPKPMIEIGGRPILWPIMKSYAVYDFTEFIICLGYKGQRIKEYFQHYEAMNNDFTVDFGGTSRSRSTAATRGTVGGSRSSTPATRQRSAGAPSALRSSSRVIASC